jgi:methionyl-tRNA formyltransferase
MVRNIYIAGKNDIACNALEYLVQSKGYVKHCIKAIPVKSDIGVRTWQKSLYETARENGVEIVGIESAYEDESALFISLEYDQIIRTKQFKTKSLYNIHFSNLPAYRGVGMAVWPLINGEKESGVTLHEINDGIDTGPIIAQIKFEIPLSWTSRDLYQAFLDNSYTLFKNNIDSLISGDFKTCAQDAIGASYFPRRLLDYSNIVIDFAKTAYQVHNQIRAFIFPEYQLPKAFGKFIIKSEIQDSYSTKKPGEIVCEDCNSICFSTLDYDVRIWFFKS